MKKSSILLSIGLILFSFTSCGVKENRDICPCWLEFFFKDCHSKTESITVCGWRDATLFRERISLSDYPIVYEKEVEKGVVKTCVYSGVENSIVNGYEFITPEGEQADKIFLHRNTIVCDGEFAHDTVVLNKQWVTVKVKVNFKEGTVPEKHSLEVRSDVIGVDVLNQIPIHGTFRYTPKMDETGRYVFRLLRHDVGSEDLYMDIYMEDTMIDQMNLTHALASRDYNWASKDLSDVEMNIDMETKDIYIKVVPWKDLGHENIIF